jgi:hypothetical protein
MVDDLTTPLDPGAPTFDEPRPEWRRRAALPGLVGAPAAFGRIAIASPPLACHRDVRTGDRSAARRRES